MSKSVCADRRPLEQRSTSLAEQGLVDRINLMMFPIVLGTGKRLFPEGIPRPALELTAVEQVGTDGVLLLTHRAKR